MTEYLLITLEEWNKILDYIEMSRNIEFTREDKHKTFDPITVAMRKRTMCPHLNIHCGCKAECEHQTDTNGCTMYGVNGNEHTI